MLDEASGGRALAVIERNTTLQAQLIDDLLDLSRIVTGKLQLELRLVDPVGVGATFIVELPLARGRLEDLDGEQDGWGVAEQERVRRLASLEGIHILIVEDESDARELLLAILHRAGADAMAVASAAEALDALQRWKAEVLVSDIGLPDADGYALIQHVRELGSESGGAVPAIALTANARPETAPVRSLPGSRCIWPSRWIPRS